MLPEDETCKENKQLLTFTKPQSKEDCVRLPWNSKLRGRFLHCNRFLILWRFVVIGTVLACRMYRSIPRGQKTITNFQYFEDYDILSSFIYSDFIIVNGWQLDGSLWEFNRSIVDDRSKWINRWVNESTINMI